LSEALYNEAILAAARDVTGTGPLAEPSLQVRSDNPLCGDRTVLELQLTDGRIASAAHQTRGCLLTKAAAGLLARHLGGRAPDELAGLRRQVEAFLRDGLPVEGFAELSIFTPVQGVRSRHDCVLLPFKALDQALGKIERRER
jgi:nitrogen fixation protein NifU and related proteins